MNPITDDYISENLGGDQSDYLSVTLKLGRENPDYLKDSEFAADFKQFDAYEKARAKERLTVKDYAKQVVGEGVRGAADIFADLPEAIAVGGSSINRKVKESTGIDLGDPENPQDSILWKLGQGIRSVSKAITPDEVEALQDSFWATSVPQGIGSAVGFMAGGGVGRAVISRGVTKLSGQAFVKGLAKEEAEKFAAKYAAETIGKEATKEQIANIAGRAVAKQMTKAEAAAWAAETIASKVAQGIPIAGLGAAAQGVGGYKEAVAAGASADDAGASFWLNALGGTSEVVPLGAWLDRLNKASGGKFAKAVFSTASETLQEAIQEGAQQFSQNYIAQKYYDKDRSLLKDMAESAAAGGVVGALFATLTHGISRSRHTPSTPEKSDASKTTTTEQTGKATGETTSAIDPAKVYQLSDDEKGAITKLAEREAGGDKSPGLHVEIGKLISQDDPNKAERYGWYKSELARIKGGSESTNQKENLTETAANRHRQKASDSSQIADDLIAEANAAFEKRSSELAKKSADKDSATKTQAELEAAAADAIDSSAETQGGGKAAGGATLTEAQKTDADPSVSGDVIPVGVEQNPPAPPSLAIPEPPTSLTGKKVKLEALSGDGSVVEAEFDADEAWKDTHQRKHIYEGLLACLGGSV